MDILLSAYFCWLLIVVSVTLFDSHEPNQYPYMLVVRDH